MVATRYFMSSRGYMPDFRNPTAVQTSTDAQNNTTCRLDDDPLIYIAHGQGMAPGPRTYIWNVQISGTARDFATLETVFGLQVNIWEGYIGAVMTMNQKSGMSNEQQVAAARNLIQQEDAIRQRADSVHLLVYHLAPSADALKLEKEGEALHDKLLKRQTVDDSRPYRPITIDERMKIDAELDKMYSELQALPKLTPEQLKKEYDAFTDEQFMHNGALTGGVGAGSE